MSYVRTKDGIFTCLDTNTLKVGDLVGPDEPILAKGDNIEELGDEFVWDENLCYINFKEKTLEVKGDDYKFNLMYCLEAKPVYCSIWTDKGLIHKAKLKGFLLNGETDWELL